MISRLGWRRAGTRFNTRGVDDDGNCANFVEVSYAYYTLSNFSNILSIDRGFIQYRFILLQLRASERKRATYVLHVYSAVHWINSENASVLGTTGIPNFYPKDSSY